MYTVFVTSETNITDQIPVEEVFILARGDALVQTTDGIANELIVGVTVSVVAVVIAAIAVISVVICIACVYYKKRVRNIEIELKEVQMVQPNPSYRGATQGATQPNPSYGGATQPNPSYGGATQPNPSYGGTTQSNPSYRQATQPNDSNLDGEYESIRDYEVVYDVIV